ncbi:MAG: class I SAM-dependent methyltransferase [Acidimicrobiales bacterium]
MGQTLGVTDNASAWDQYAAAYQAAIRLPTDVAHYGPDLPTEADLRLVGEVKARRVLDLGCGGGQAAIAFAKQGASVTGVDFSTSQLAHARQLCDAEGVKVEWRQADIADLAFLRSDSVDVVFSAGALGFVEDIGRVFRQVHRVLKVGAPMVFSLPHPASALIDEDAEQPLLVRHPYFEAAPVTVERDGVAFAVYPHTFAEIFMGLMRTSFRVEAIVEPEPVSNGPRSAFWRDAFRFVPRTLIVKARKAGN